MASNDKYLCPGIDTCKNKKCEHGKPHTHDFHHCFGGTCYIISEFVPNMSPKELAQSRSLVCEKITGGKKK